MGAKRKLINCLYLGLTISMPLYAVDEPIDGAPALSTDEINAEVAASKDTPNNLLSGNAEIKTNKDVKEDFEEDDAQVNDDEDTPPIINESNENTTSLEQENFIPHYVTQSWEDDDADVSDLKQKEEGKNQNNNDKTSENDLLLSTNEEKIPQTQDTDKVYESKETQKTTTNEKAPTKEAIIDVGTKTTSQNLPKEEKEELKTFNEDLKEKVETADLSKELEEERSTQETNQAIKEISNSIKATSLNESVKVNDTTLKNTSKENETLNLSKTQEVNPNEASVNVKVNDNNNNNKEEQAKETLASKPINEEEKAKTTTTSTTTRDIAKAQQETTSNKNIDASKNDKASVDVVSQMAQGLINVNSQVNTLDKKTSKSSEQDNLQTLVNENGEAKTLENKDVTTLNTQEKASSIQEIKETKDKAQPKNKTLQSPYLESKNFDNKSSENLYYTHDYLENMYLPYFKNTYELPQKLDKNVILKDVLISTRDSGLIFEVSASDSIGPLDLDGFAADNQILRNFCKIALSDGILHRVNDIIIDFYHGNDKFYTSTLNFSSCGDINNKELKQKLLKVEDERLDNEFIYAFEQEKQKLLSMDYLKNKFIPYASNRIDEKFLSFETNQLFTLEENNLIINFLVKDGEKVDFEKLPNNRIARTCDIKTYSFFILPRVNSIVYRYFDTKGSLKKEVTLLSDTCLNLRKKFDLK